MLIINGICHGKIQFNLLGKIVINIFLAGTTHDWSRTATPRPQRELPTRYEENYGMDEEDDGGGGG